MSTPTAGRLGWQALVALVIISGCSAGPSRSDTPPPATTGPTTIGTGQPGYIGTLPPPPGRAASDVVAGPLTLNALRVFADPATGRFAWAGNVTNTGDEFLNEISFTLTVLDDDASIVDSARVTIPQLATGETASVGVTGTAAHHEGWVAVGVVDLVTGG